MKPGYILNICFILLISLKAYSQKNAKVIIDAATKQPIDYVYVSSDDKSLNVLSNKDGKLVLVLEGAVKSYNFYKIGYRKRNVTVPELLKTDSIFLYEEAINLETINITSGIIDTVVKDKRFYVNDYLVLPNNDVLLITSKINISGFEVLYFKKGRGVTHTKKIKTETGEHLFLDCFKNVHLVTGGFSRQFYFDSDSTFDFLPKYTRAQFESALAPCILKLDSQVLVKNSLPPVVVKGEFLQNAFFLNYFKTSKNKKELFYSVGYNKEMIEMIEHEISDEEFIKLTPAAMEAFHRLFYTKIAAPIYAPAFLKSDTVIIFNFQEMQIVSLNKKGEVLHQTAINEKNFSTFRDFEVIYDNPKQIFYIKTKSSDRISLQVINIFNGEIGTPIKLEKVFAKNIQVQNGKIYYLVKEKNWDDTCYLYQQN